MTFSSTFWSSSSSPWLYSLAGFHIFSSTHSTPTLSYNLQLHGADSHSSLLKSRISTQIGRRCGSIPTLPLAGKDIRCPICASFSPFTMTSILLIPTHEIPFHFLCFPVPQQETLITHVLVYLRLSMSIADTPTFRADPVLTQLIPLF